MLSSEIKFHDYGFGLQKKKHHQRIGPCKRTIFHGISRAARSFTPKKNIEIAHPRLPPLGK